MPSDGLGPLADPVLPPLLCQLGLHKWVADPLWPADHLSYRRARMLHSLLYKRQHCARERCDARREKKR